MSVDYGVKWSIQLNLKISIMLASSESTRRICTNGNNVNDTGDILDMKPTLDN